MHSMNGKGMFVCLAMGAFAALSSFSGVDPAATKVYARYCPIYRDEWPRTNSWVNGVGDLLPLCGYLGSDNPDDVETEIALASAAGIEAFLIELDGNAGSRYAATLEQAFFRAKNRGAIRLAVLFAGSDSERLSRLVDRGRAAGWFEMPEYMRRNGKPRLFVKADVKIPEIVEKDFDVTVAETLAAVQVADYGLEEALAKARRGGREVLLETWNAGTRGPCLLPDMICLNFHLQSVWRVCAEGDRAKRIPAVAMNRFWEPNAAIGKPLDLPTPDFENLKYGPHMRQSICLWHPQGVPKPEAGYPILVLIHGGGWEAGDHMTEAYGDFARRQKHGIALATISYRVLQNARRDSVKPPVQYPLEDAVASLRYLRRNAARIGIDPARIMLMGGSAGGFSSLYAAFQNDCELGIRAIFVASPQTSMDPQEIFRWIPNLSYGHKAFDLPDCQALLAARETLLPWIEQYSPMGLVRKLAHPARAPKMFYTCAPTPKLGELREDTAHHPAFCLEFEKVCTERGVFFRRGTVDDAIRALRD